MRKDLIEAYKGYYERELELFAKINDRSVADKLEEMIRTSTPKKRLHVYLTWNGIIGYTESIYAIATGEI